MASHPLISVIIPTFNSARTIREAIDSIQTPSGYALEIIVVDDGSTDNTAEVLGSMLEKGQIRYECKKNGGAASARNHGLEMATGRYICFLDSDDQMLPDSLECRLKMFERFPAVDVVFGDYFIVNNEEDKSTPLTPVLAVQGFTDIAAEYIDSVDQNMVLFNNRFHNFYLRANPRPITTCSVMISSEIVRQRGVFNTNYSIGEDNDYWQRLILGNSVGFINKPVFTYLHYRSNLTSNVLEYLDEEIKYNHNLKSRIAKDIREEFKNWLFVRRRLSECSFEKGYFFYKNNEMFKARSALKNSICYWLFNLKAYKVFLLCLFKNGPWARSPE